MTVPLFTIVTVTLNCAEEALRTARSVQAQDFLDYQYIVKDGGSTDGTVERMRELGVSVCVSEDSGIYDAMNQALKLCQGEYVYFLNAGDTFFDTSVLSKVAGLIDHSAAICYGHVHLLPIQRRTDYPPVLSRYYLFRKNLNHQAWVARRDVCESLNGFNLSYPYVADQEFLWRTVLEHHLPTQHIDVVLAYFAYGGASSRRSAAGLVRRERKQLLRQFYPRWETLLYGAAGLYFLNGLKSRLWRMWYSKLVQ